MWQLLEYYLLTSSCFINFLINDVANDDHETPVTTVSTSLIDCTIFEAILPTIDYWTARRQVVCHWNRMLASRCFISFLATHTIVGTMVNHCSFLQKKERINIIESINKITLTLLIK
jgi:hypothetical protein